LDTNQTKIVEIQVGNNFSYVITRFQFPIQLVPTSTIHCAQGWTLDPLTLDPMNKIKHGLTHTQLSKICSKENLCLLCQLSNNFFQINLMVKREMTHLFKKWEMWIKN
jgi:hypothetical protein